jgi:hypothetical protein
LPVLTYCEAIVECFELFSVALTFTNYCLAKHGFWQSV